MATSGTVSTTVFTTRKVIDHAYLNCRLKPQVITGEMVQIALDKLHLLLSHLVSKGAPLWTREHHAVDFRIGRPTVNLPVGTLDVLNLLLAKVDRLTGTYSSSEGTAANAFDQDQTTICTHTNPAGNIQVTLAEAGMVDHVGILPHASGSWTYSLQWSDDGATWTTEAGSTLIKDVVAGRWTWAVVPGQIAHKYWRILAGASTTLNVREVVFGRLSSTIPVSRLNMDDYDNLGNRLSRGRPLNFYSQGKIQTDPRILLWPVPDETVFYDHFLWAHLTRHIQDVGTMAQELEIPQRWFDAITWELARILSLCTPEVKREDRAGIKEEAQVRMAEMWTEERDNSPLHLHVDISPYTQ